MFSLFIPRFCGLCLHTQPTFQACIKNPRRHTIVQRFDGYISLTRHMRTSSYGLRLLLTCLFGCALLLACCSMRHAVLFLVLK